MIILFSISFISLLINACLFRGMSKTIRYIFLTILFVLFVYITLDPTLTFDTSIYQYYYDNPNLAHFEIGYIYLMKIGNIFNLTFYQFRGALFIIEIFFIMVSLYRFKIKNVNLFLLLYTILHFFESPVQLRNYLMATIVLLAFSFIRDRSIAGYIIFILLIGLGATIQSSAAFFLPFVVYYKWQGKKMDQVLITYTTVFVLLIIFGPIRNFVSVIVGNLLTPFGVTGAKAASYLNRLTPGQIILADIPYTIFIYYFFKNNQKRNFSQLASSTKLSGNIQLVKKAFFFLIYMFPMYLFAYNFNRILIDSFLLFFVGIVTMSDSLKRDNKTIGIDKYTIIGVFVTLSYSVCSYLYGTKYLGTIIPVLFHNTYFGG